MDIVRISDPEIVKAPIALKNRHSIIQERLNKLINGKNSIINVASDSL